MSELVATAERLRVVKDACIDFITLWALDCMMDERRSSDRICGDVLNAAESSDKNSYSLLHSSRRMDD
jgi:hypothetical protein